MSTMRNDQAAWPSAGTILPKPEKLEHEPEEVPYVDSEPVDIETDESEATNNETDETTPEEVPKTPVTVKEPTFEETLEPWIMAFKPKSKWSVWPMLKWWVYTRLRLFKYEWISPPETLTRNGMRKEIAENEKYVNSRRRIIFTTSATSSGGGKGKTTITNTLAAYTSMFFRNGVALIGLDLGADKTVSRFHMEDEKILPTTMLVKALEAGSKFYPSDLVPYTDSDADTGLILFKAKAEQDTTTLDYSDKEVSELIRYMNRLYPPLFCDGGPGLNLMTTNGMIRASNIYILPIKGLSDESSRDVRKVIEHPPYNLRAKTERILVPISAVLKSKLNTRTQWKIAAECGVEPRNVVLIPQDRYLDDQVAVNLMRVSIFALRLKTRLMYSRLMRRNVEIAETFQPIPRYTNPQEKNNV